VIYIESRRVHPLRQAFRRSGVGEPTDVAEFEGPLLLGPVPQLGIGHQFEEYAGEETSAKNHDGRRGDNARRQ